jgi:hypothetical protein
MLRDDWLEFSSRPWVQGPIDTFFANKHLAAVTAANPLLEAAVDSFILAGDKALQEVRAGAGLMSCSCWHDFGML